MAFRLPASPVARAALLLAAAAIVVLGYVGGGGFLERRAQAAELERLRDGLGRLRAASEECQIAVQREERAFEEYRAEVDSLRQEIRDFESLDDRGVPAEQYEEYLEAFDDYNESVPLWEERADSLRARSEACRALVERHNTLADSLRTFIEQVETGR